MIVSLLILTVYYHSAHSQSNNALQTLYKQFKDDQQKLQSQETELDHLRQKLRHSQNAGHPPDALQMHGEPASQSQSHDKDKDEWNQNDEKWIKDIQANDYKSLRLEYGEGPIQILIETNLGCLHVSLSFVEDGDLEYFAL